MNHDEFVGQVQHRAHLPSRGAAELVIRATLETLGERLQRESASHVAAQLPPEIGRHLEDREFCHLSLAQFWERIAQREHADVQKSMFHARCVLETLLTAVSPGTVKKLSRQLPQEFQSLLLTPATY